MTIPKTGTPAEGSRMNIRTYEVDDEWVAADDSGWLPGTYPTREAAIAAAESNGDA